MLDMFCALNGATRRPRCFKCRQIAVVIQLFPTCDAVPPTKMAFARLTRLVTTLDPACSLRANAHEQAVVDGPEKTERSNGAKEW